MDKLTFENVKRTDIYKDWRKVYDLLYLMRNEIHDDDISDFLIDLKAGEDTNPYENICGAIRMFQIPITQEIYNLIEKIGIGKGRDPSDWEQLKKFIVK